MVGQKGSYHALSIVVLIVLILSGVFLVSEFSQPGNYDSQTVIKSSNNNNTSNSDRDNQSWETYTHKAFGFEIQIPKNSSIDLRNENYIRIQNYTEEDVINNNHRLTPGQYYLEIFKNLGACENSLESYQQIQIDGISLYKGQAVGEGDSAKIRTSLCWNKAGSTYFMRASEEYPVYSDKIIESFEFIN